MARQLNRSEYNYQLCAYILCWICDNLENSHNKKFHFLVVKASIWLYLNEWCHIIWFKANLMVQEARLNSAQGELSKAQGELDAKETELALVREKFDNAMKEKQVNEFALEVACLTDDISQDLLLLLHGWLTKILVLSASFSYFLCSAV